MPGRRVAEAFAAVPRVWFLPPAQQPFALIDRALPIGWEVTNSQPTTVRAMLDLLDPQPGDRVLDVGAGSAWTTALLAHLVGPAGRVVGVERIPDLVEIGRANLARHGFTDAPDPPAADPAHPPPVGRGRVRGHAALHLAEPGVLGRPQEAPYDRILVSADAQHVPQALVDQLVEGGVMVLPVRGVMHRVRRTADGVETERHGRFLFVPLIED